MNLTDIVPDEELRAALGPYRPDRAQFEAAVRGRLSAAHAERSGGPGATASVQLPPLLRSAAAFLPLELLAGCGGSSALLKTVPATGLLKLLGVVAFPAISLFLLFGAALFGVAGVHAVQGKNSTPISDEAATQKAVGDWWHEYRWASWAVFSVSFALMLVGATSLLFFFYLVSFGLLLFVLASLSRLGVGNRTVVGRSCGMGLMFLGQASMVAGLGSREIHFIDQKLISAVFYAGFLLLAPFVMRGLPMAQGTSEVARRNASYSRRLAGVFMVILLLPLVVWSSSTLLWPATPARLKHFVESFREAPFSSSTWHQWEIVARLALDEDWQPDLTLPKQLLSQEIAGEQNRFILTEASRAGLLERPQVSQLREYASMRATLLRSDRSSAPEPITSLGQYEWVLRAAMLRGDLRPAEIDVLELRLLDTLDTVPGDPYAVLETPLRVTQLLDALGRPVDHDRYRAAIHGLLREFHCPRTWWSLNAGGFRKYRGLAWPSLDGTADAVELMQLYGVPEGFNVTSVRSYLKHRAEAFISAEWAINAAALTRLNELPGVARPSWLDLLYYERSLLAAIVLVGLCLYATWISPQPKQRLDKLAEPAHVI